MSFDSQAIHPEAIIDGGNPSPSKIKEIKATRGKVFTIIDSGRELIFTDEFVSDLFSDTSFNGTLYPVAEGFYFLGDYQDNLTDFAIVSEKYITETIRGEVNIGVDAYQVGTIGDDSMYVIYAGNDRNRWSTLNSHQTYNALEKIKIDSVSQ